jgi:outer membrane protein TolC
VGGARQVKSLQEAVKAAELTYTEQTRDYRFGLTGNLDVLSALNTLLDTRRTLDHTRFQLLNSWVGLQASVGRIPKTP